MHLGTDRHLHLGHPSPRTLWFRVYGTTRRRPQGACGRGRPVPWKAGTGESSCGHTLGHHRVHGGAFGWSSWSPPSCPRRVRSLGFQRRLFEKNGSFTGSPPKDFEKSRGRDMIDPSNRLTSGYTSKENKHTQTLRERSALPCPRQHPSHGSREGNSLSVHQGKKRSRRRTIQIEIDREVDIDVPWSHRNKHILIW